jgi:hypothetical protein
MARVLWLCALELFADAARPRSVVFQAPFTVETSLDELRVLYAEAVPTLPWLSQALLDVYSGSKVLSVRSDLLGPSQSWTRNAAGMLAFDDKRIEIVRFTPGPWMQMLLGAKDAR